MSLKLEKPIIFFDLETTGINIATDRIVEIYMLKIFPNGNKESKEYLINPEINIPQEVSEIHGINNETVKDAPTFKEISHEILEFIKDSNIAGYNSNRFDIPLLAEEFIRSNVEWNLKNIHTVDIQQIFHRLEKRTLEAAYKFYCNKELVNAHSAKSDTLATYEVLIAQIKKYDELENDVQFLSDYSNNDNSVDLAGFIRYNQNKKEIFSFGKYKNQKIEDIWKKNPGYFSWIDKASFPVYTKITIRNLINKIRLENKLNN